MGGQALVFPVLILLFGAGMIGWANTVPVEPAPDNPDLRNMRVQYGDIVHIEATWWYSDTADGAGFVFLSTQEERWNATPGLPVSPSLPGEFQTAPAEFPMPATRPAQPSGIVKSLLGHRVGEAFTTARIPPSEGLGDWENTITASKSLPSRPIQEARGGPGQSAQFNLTSYENFWRNVLGVQSLDVGTLIPCDGLQLWNCRVVAIDRDQGRIELRREITQGMAYPAAPLLASAGPTAELITFNGTVHVDEGGATYHARIEPRVGDYLQIQGSAGPNLPAGTYLVTQVDEDSFTARHTRSLLQLVQMIGATTWYDFVIVDIVRAMTA